MIGNKNIDKRQARVINNKNDTIWKTAKFT